MHKGLKVSYLAHEGYKKAIDDKTGSIPAVYHVLTNLAPKLRNCLDGIGIGVVSLDDLYQFHNLHGVEKVKANKLVGSSRGNCHVCNSQRRRI